MSLSDTEKKRLLRAYHRLQTYHNIFGAPEFPINDPSHGFDNEWWSGDCNVVRSMNKVWRLFFATIPFWEFEEFACIWVYFCERYAPILDEISDELTENGKGVIEKYDIEIPNSILMETTDLCPDGRYRPDI